MSSVDLVFPVAGVAIPRDHGYSLYAGLSHRLSVLHSCKGVGVFAIRGTPTASGTLALDVGSSLRIRVPADRLPLVLPLSGQTVDVGGNQVRIGAPRVEALTPAPRLASRLVLIKLAHLNGRGLGPDGFLQAVRKQLDALGVGGDPGIPLVERGPHTGEPRRRILRVKNQTHAGYSMVVDGLTAEESVRLQEAGIGGRRLMGCGLFGPERGF